MAQYLTQEGSDKYKAELEELTLVKRKEVQMKIAEARAQGDLSENAEYDAAKTLQGQVEDRIKELEALLRNAIIISDDQNKEGMVSMGNSVLLYDVEFDEEIEYKIVGSTEADPSKGLISNASPIGKGLLGKAEGETVKIKIPDGEVTFKIIKVTK